MLKKYLSLFILSALSASMIPLVALADDSVDESTIEALTSEDSTLSSSSSKDAVKGKKTVTESVSRSDYSDEALAEMVEDWNSGAYPDTVYISVRWGYFDIEDISCTENQICFGRCAYYCALGLDVTIFFESCIP